MEVIKIKRGATLQGRFRFICKEAGTENIVNQTDWSNNLISTAEDNGLANVMNHLMGDTTYALPITHARFGTTDVTPVAGDTDIDSPLAYDIQIADRETISSTERKIIFFAPNVYIPDDTYYTFATYSGTQTFSMALIRDTNVVDFVKAGSVDITIEYLYEITNA